MSRVHEIGLVSLVMPSSGNDMSVYMVLARDVHPGSHEGLLKSEVQFLVFIEHQSCCIGSEKEAE